MKTLHEKAKSLREEILELLGYANLDEVFKLLVQLGELAGPKKLESTLQLKFRYHNLKQEDAQGILSRDQYNLERNRLLKDIIDYTSFTYEEVIHTPEVKEADSSGNEEGSLPDVNGQEVIFKCQDVGKTYKKTKFSLSNINLQLEVGKITAVAGANAVGKTTLLRMIAGELLQDYGTVEYPFLKGDQKFSWTRIKKQIAFIPQELPLWNGTLKNSLHFEAAIHGIKGEKNNHAVDAIIHALGLEKYLDNSWHQLSGGFKLRFLLARALVWNPKLLVLDEPLAFLDIKAQRVVLNDIRNMVQNGKTPLSVILSSQHLSAVEEIADYYIFLNDQRIIYQGDASNINASSTTQLYELRCDASASVLQQAFAPVNGRINTLYPSVYTLEVEKNVPEKEILSKLASLSPKLKRLVNITDSLKRFFI